MLTSYHVHSTHSDGRNSIRELVRAAVDVGLDEIGISDHYVVLPRPDHPARVWSMPSDNLPAYFQDIREAAAEVKDKLVVRFGLEADFAPETVDELSDILRQHPFDYVIGSVHYINGFPVDGSKEDWDALTIPERDDMMRAYWDRIGLMAKSRAFDFAGHLDLYKKFGHLPSVDMSMDIAAALDAIAGSKMAVEINTSGWYMGAGEAYPSPPILAECRKRGIPILVNADAHVTDNLTRGLDRAFDLAREVGYSDVVKYESRRPGRTALPVGRESGAR